MSPTIRKNINPEVDWLYLHHTVWKNIIHVHHKYNAIIMLYGNKKEMCKLWYFCTLVVLSPCSVLPTTIYPLVDRTATSQNSHITHLSLINVIWKCQWWMNLSISLHNFSLDTQGQTRKWILLLHIVSPQDIMAGEGVHVLWIFKYEIAGFKIDQKQNFCFEHKV